MYSDHDKRPSAYRANDEFLRRMLGGELTGGTLPVMNTDLPGLSEESLPRQEGNGPLCDGSMGHGGMAGGNCQKEPWAPSLAMVYAPRQCWRNLLDPQSALSEGSLFAELILPLEVGKRPRGTEGKVCK